MKPIGLTDSQLPLDDAFYVSLTAKRFEVP